MVLLYKVASHRSWECLELINSKQTFFETNKYYGQTDSKTDGQTDSKTDEQADRKTDKLIETDRVRD